MTVIEQLFGPGIKYGELSKEQLKALHKVYAENRKERLTEEEVRRQQRKSMANYREKNKERYREYQREYRRNRIANDPEFAKRVSQHSANWGKRQTLKEGDINIGE